MARLFRLKEIAFVNSSTKRGLVVLLLTGRTDGREERVELELDHSVLHDLIYQLRSATKEQVNQWVGAQDALNHP